MQWLFDFIEDEDGAVTVDWVVLTAAVVGMAMLVLNPIAFQSESLATQVGSDIMSVPVGFDNY